MFRHVSLRHLMIVSLGVTALGILWCLIVAIARIDAIWYVPGGMLFLTGLLKAVTVRMWTRIMPGDATRDQQGRGQ